MLMRASDRGVHRYRPLQLTGSIRVGQQLCEHAVQGPVRRPPLEAAMNGLPGTELDRKVTPRDTRSCPVDHAFHHRPVRPRRPAHQALLGRQQRLDPGPGGIAENVATRHTPTIPASALTTFETRPSSCTVSTKQARN